jgi:hypothetical protein
MHDCVDIVTRTQDVAMNAPFRRGPFNAQKLGIVGDIELTPLGVISKPARYRALTLPDVP